MAKTAADLLIKADPRLEKNRDLLLDMLARPDDFILEAFGCSVRRFLERNGVDIVKDPQRMKLGVMAQELPSSFR